MSLVNKSIEYEVRNFWDVNPQLIYIHPFSELYNNDESKDKEISSKDMWCVFFMSDPDEDKNKFYRIPEKDRILMLQETYHNTFDTQNELIKKCLEGYISLCLTSVERALKAEKDALVKRADFLNNAEYNYDTMRDLDNAFSKTSKIYENFEAIEERFIKHKTQSRVKGGRKESASEKGLL